MSWFTCEMVTRRDEMSLTEEINHRRFNVEVITNERRSGNIMGELIVDYSCRKHVNSITKL